MDSSSTNHRAVAVAAAAAHGFNNELTVILSSAAAALATLDAQHPARQLLLEIQAASQRCVWKAAALLNYSARVSPGPVRASFEYLVGE